MAASKHCYRHPDRETRISCSTCGKPICTECMRQTDVGIKCPDDARLPRGARAGVMKPRQILRAVGAGVGVALAGIFVTYLIIFQIGFGSILLSGLAGYGAGTLIYRAGGYNGGPIVMTISAVAVLVAFAPWVFQFLTNGTFGIVLITPLVAMALSLVASRG